MSDDLVKRLRQRTVFVDYRNGNVGDVPDTDCNNAADAIERLTAEVAASTKHAQLLNKMLGEAEAEAARLREALQGMVHYAQYSEGWQDDHPEYLRRAEAALRGEEG